jgi:hypothetical protein
MEVTYEVEGGAAAGRLVPAVHLRVCQLGRHVDFKGPCYWSLATGVTSQMAQA